MGLVLNVKRAMLISLILSIMLCMSACSDNTDTGFSSETPKIDKNVTVEQSLRDNWWTNQFDVKNFKYNVFDTWENGKPTDYKYALISCKKPDKEGIMDVALVYFKDTKENGDDYDYLFNCPGVYVSSVPEGMENGDSFIFGPVPIAGPNGDYRDICVGYSEDGWFLVNDVKMPCEDNGIITYLTEHGYEIQFGDFRPKE